MGESLGASLARLREQQRYCAGPDERCSHQHSLHFWRSLLFDFLSSTVLPGSAGAGGGTGVGSSGISIEERDAAVIAAEGRIVESRIQSTGLRAGRPPRTAVEDSYYLIRISPATG